MKQKIFASFSDSVSEREEKNRETAYEAACEGIVLLKNDSALPVKPGKIALFGAGVSRTVKGGTGSGEVNERHAVTILEGMKSAGYEITTEAWITEYETLYGTVFNEWKSENHRGKDIINQVTRPFLLPYGRAVSEKDIAAAGCDTAVYVVARQAGEGNDKKIENGEFDLAPVEIESISRIAESFEKSILVINSGSYMNIGDLDEKVSAVIYFCQQGMEGGRALADIISGKVNPSGRLTDTWARSYNDVPYGREYSYMGDPRRQYYKEGIYVGYRYYDAFGVEPRYRFGYGLSYTEFKTECLEVSWGCVKAKITNTGSVPGKETVMLFARNECLKLIGFAKTGLLAAGQSEEVAIRFTPDYLAVYDEKKASFVIPEGDTVLYLDDAEIAALRNGREQTVSKLKNILAAHISQLSPSVKKTEYKGSRIIPVPEIKTETAAYGERPVFSDEKVDAVMKRLSKKEMVDVCVGEGLAGMMKSNGNFAPGTVGRTTSALSDKGLPNVNLSDGPAGLRLLQKSGLTKGGKMRFEKGHYMMQGMDMFPEWAKKLVSPPKGSRTLYQFTTAFPVETALAQTWNEKLCEKVGEAISREMDEYGITYWLAPAVNIHKNPLCGRNFEYMSEDPVLTGKMAAALIRGVQSIDGNYATVKHFACNNIEDDRNHSDSIVNEKALREIYLRAFEICVKEGGVKSVMTSYNKLNGIYTANSYELCTDILRNEWGFDGVVMTDWFSTGNGLGDAGLAVKAGNDLLMPGMASDKKSIMRNASDEEIRRAAANIIRQVLYSNVNSKK